MTEEERQKRIEALRERMRRTDERLEQRRGETERVLAIIDRALAKLAPYR